MNRKASAPFLIRFFVLFSVILSASAASFATTVATPTFSPTAGSYTGTQSVTISDTTSGATIYYTTNGSTPTSSSTHYTAAISVSTSETVKAIAEKSGDTNSAVASAAYTITVSTPTFSPAAGSYTGTQSVTISDATSGATIYYTTNGSTPTSSSTQYTGAISVSTSETVKAIAELSGATNSAVASAAYTITLPTPTFSPVAGSYTGTQSVTISDATSGATIYYTTNGSTPTSSSAQYSGAISVSTSETVKAIAELSGATNSAVASAAYTITLPTPTFSPAAGTYTSVQSVTISDATSGATIYYTANGSTPTSSSTQYTGAISVSTSETIKAIAELSGATNSSVASAAYTINLTVATPAISPAAGSYTGTQSVTISDTTSGATIYYTTNGTTPTSSSTQYTGAISVSISETIKAIAELSGSANSAVASAAYTITLPTPILSPAAGSYTGAQSVTISDATAGVSIYYTTNGTTPTSSSTHYTGAISVSASETIEAIAELTGATNSPVVMAVYTITVATPIISPAAGSYTSAQSVTISDSTSGATIYYTTNGTTPTSSSTHYTGAVPVSTSETVKAIAELTGATNSAVASAAYTITSPAAAPTYSLATGTYTSAQTVTISDSTSGASIYYTTDGSTPTTSSTLYSGAIHVTATETIEAIASGGGFSASSVASATYTIVPPGTVGTLQILISPPDAQSTAVSGALTETFDSLSPAIYTTPYVSTAGIGTYTGGTNNPIGIVAPDEFGGATDSQHSSPTNYFGVGVESGSTASVTLALTHPAAYFGFWWSAGDAYNRVALYSGSTLYGTFSTADLLNFLNNGSGTITAGNGSTYQASSYFGNPNITTGSNDGTEPFAYISFVISNTTIDHIVFYNLSASTGFESDNHSVIYSGNTVAIPSTYVPVETLTLGSQAAPPVFTPAAGSYTGPQTVMISTTTAGASINYTTDGTTPSATHGTLYTAPIPVSQPETIQAIAFETGLTSSSVVSAVYSFPVSVAVAPTSATLSSNGEQQFTATVFNTTNTAVTWGILPSGIGSLSSSGLYNAPTTVTTQQTVTVTATSQADTTKSASAIVTLVPVWPNGGPAGTVVTINGDGFGTAEGPSSVTVGGLPAVTLSWSDTQIQVQIPTGTGLGSQEIVVTVGNQTIAQSTFTVTTGLVGITPPPTGLPASITIGTPSQTAPLIFNGTAGQLVSVQLSGGTAFSQSCDQVFLTILNPDGSTLIGQNWCESGVRDLVTLPTTGIYTLVINPQGATGSTNLTLWEFSNLTGTIASGVPYPLTVNVPGQQALLSFSGTAGQIATVQLTGGTNFTPSCDQVYVTILNPDGSTLTGQNWCEGGIVDLATLPSTGTYTLVINPQGATGSANVTLWEYGNITGTITPNISYPLTIGIPGQEALLSFSGTAGQTASVQLAGGTNFTPSCDQVYVTILNPDGSTLAGQNWCEGGVVDLVTLPTTGTYTLVINPRGATGSTNVTLWEYGNITGTITPNIPYPLTISFPGQEALLSFSGTAGHIANLQLSGGTNFSPSCDQIVLTILNPGGSPLIGQDWCESGVVDLVTLPTTGTYTLVVNPQGATGSTSILLTEAAASLTVAPPGVTLAGGQTQQFTANVVSITSNPTINWAITPATGAGTVTSSGLYTAPATISTQQTVTVTASATTGNGNLSGAAQVKLTPLSPSIAVQPLSVTLIAGQTQQYSASITNVGNTAVTWAISPADAGTLSASGLYTAPPVVTAQKVVTITATSQAVPSLSASAALTLLPANCAAQSYGYERAIAIDHTKVPESDQPNFPFYFAATDPLLATVANGGHMASASGYDVEFSSDPAGQHTLSYELEQYNPATGQIVAWVQVPVLSHTQDTVIYMFYGNPAITAPQQSPAGVWDSSYLGVYQFDNNQSGVVFDSTSNGNNAVDGGLQQAAGTPGGAATFDGATSFVLLPSKDFPSFPASGSSGAIFNSSVAVWFKTASTGVILGQIGTGGSGGAIPALYVDTTGYLRANFFDLQNEQQIVSPTVLNDNNWHQAVLTFDTNATQNSLQVGGGATSTTSGLETLYVDGQIIATQNGVIPSSYSSGYSYFLGTGYASGWANTPNLNNGWFYFNGDLDEVEVSSIARSSGWIAAEYNNQNAPSTFFALSPEAGSGGSVKPSAVTLYGSQSQQFTVLQTGLCNAGDAVWSMPSGSPGTLSPTGLYTAPASIGTPRTVTVTGTTLGANSTPLSATVTLMPPVAIVVSPGLASLPAGATQQFAATVTNATNTAVTWALDPAGVGSVSATGLYTAPATLNGQQTVTVIATSQADNGQSASATITLAIPGPQPQITVSVSPLETALYGGQSQQFNANVTNATNTAVTWSISPAGVGTLSTTGLYTAPASVTTQQTLTITATSQANSAFSASASIDLDPTVCAANGYSYVRQIVINSSQVPNTDQTDFPFLFESTDPLLANTANGGHVTNPNGDDIVFSTDPSGLTKLNHEIEEYNPSTGTLIAWVSIPVLSHSTNTVLYMFYGNSSITTPQQNPTGVWDSNYGGVWHLGGNGTALSTADSTANANNATVSGAASPTQAEIGFGAALAGYPNYINAGNSASVSPTHTGTMSIWVNYNSFADWTTPMGNGNTTRDTNGALFWNYPSGELSFEVDGPGGVSRATAGNLATGEWYYLTGTWNGSTVSLYENGTLVGSAAQNTDASPAYNLVFGADGALSESGDFLNGRLEEARVSSIARSADWIASEYNNQSSPSTFFTIFPETSEGVSPATATLFGGQSQQFIAVGICSGGVTWSLSAGAPGAITSGGVYTAPSSIASQQTVTVTATSVANPGQTTSAMVTLVPLISVAVSPSSSTLNANQTQNFTATVTNASNPSVVWSISPAGTGSIDQTGAYVAPSSIATQQTVTITATSQEDPTKSGSAMITLSPTNCASTGYGYQRVIVIDHTKVANTDQINYPFMFNSTDPDLATVDHGGHVTNRNGYDIIFSTDPNGQTKLDFEVEQYNPVTGQLVTWIRIPTLSHTSDTIIYVFYGNPAITASQANPTGVWDSNYQAVFHLGNLPSTNVASDSTNYANNASFTNLTPEPGMIDGSASLDGATSFLNIPATAFPNYPTGVYSNNGVNTAWNNTTFAATYGIWFKTASWGALLDQTAGETCNDDFLGVCLGFGPEQAGDTPQGSWGGMLDINFNGNLEGRGVSPSTQIYNDNNWHYATITFENGVDNLYADGQLIGTGQQGTFGFSPNYAYLVGAEDVESDTSSLDSQPWQFLNGQIDEINVSSTARSGDWIETQFNNQSSPSTFYNFYSPTAVQVAPSSISLYASESEQFTVSATCDSTISWSIPAGSPGTLTSSGLYAAPSAISSQQTVTVSATSQSNGSSLGSALVTLLPPPQPLTLVASSPSPYLAGSSQTFTATLLDPQGNPQIGVSVNFTVAGVNEGAGSATTGSGGIASYTYTGSNSGSDTIQATASVDGELLTSNSITAAWLTPPPAQAPTVSLLPQPSPGRGALIGAFVDNNGDVIEPIVVGTAARTFVTPAGATRLQLGVNDNYYEDNGGSGFVVKVNGLNVTVPPTAMPWNWTTGGLNNNYQYGINDGSDPVVAVANLAAGENVTVAYQSGTVSTDSPIRPLVSATGETDFITGTQVFQGAYFPTLYTTGTSYPENQPITVFAVVADATGAPIPNASVTLNVIGANPGQYQAVSDATGTASFLYTGQNAGNDNLQAQAVVSGQGTLTSNLSAIDWTNYPTPPPVGSLSLNEIVSIVNSQSYSSFARDASGNPLPNMNVGFYITGVDNFQSSLTTNNIGEAYFSYYHTQSGNYRVIAVDSVDRNVIVSQPYTGTWVVPSGTPSATGGTISVNITANTTVTMPNALALNGTVTDSSGLTPTLTWTEVSGPGTAIFANPSQAVTTATFSQVGTYVVELFATDSVNSGYAQFTVTVLQPSVASESQGWIGAPIYGSSVTGIVPITLAPGVSIASGTLSYFPANNPNSVTSLNANVSGTGQIGTLDTTMLQNGSYWIQMQATNTGGTASYSLVLVTVTGNYKPGRVTTTVTDLVVPSTGLAINIQRTYDSLNAGTSGDFGFGWNLGINVNLVVDPSGNVTFTLGGQRKTFYLTPQAPPCTIVGCLFPFYFVAFTPEPGLHGTLTDSSQGCPLDIVQPNGSLWECYGGSGQYTPPGYIYTDPAGTQYNISAGGSLQSINDRNGNGLTITPNGITSTTGLNVPFVRDAQNRITQITDPQGNVYLYGYDANGNLATVTYPNTPQPSTYSYNSNHYYLSGTDFRSNPLPTAQYFTSADTDPAGNPLSGKLESVTDGSGETTSYAYNLSTNTTTVTYPPDAGSNIGHATMVYDALGDVLTSTDPLNHTTTNTYNANRDLLSTTDPLGHTTSYTYDANGNKTSQTYPATATSTNTTSTTNYNQFSEPTSTTDELGNVRTFNYDASYNPASVTDSAGTLMSTIFNADGTLQAGAIGFDLTQAPTRASQFTYDANGDLTSKTDALGRTTSYTYNALGQKITMVEPIPSGSNAAAATTTYQYDAFGNLTQTSAPLGRVTSSQYDGNGNKTSDTDARGHTTTYQYDNLNRLILTTYPDTTTSSKTYDFRNNVVTETDQGGHVTLHQYDLAGRQISVTQAYGTANATTTSYTYDNAGRKTSETDALSHVTNYTYDAAGNLLSVAGVKGNFSYAFDNARNQIAMTDGNGNETQYQYDARKRLTLTTYPDSTTKTNAYDGPGNLVSVTDQAGNQVQYTYDAANQLASVVQVNSPNTNANTTIYGYDANGNPITFEDANTHTTVNSFDLLSELTQKTLPDGTLTETRQYDNNGNLSSVTHFNGAVTTYTYDTLNRLLSRATPGETTVSHTYTATGKYLSTTDSSGTTSYTYDTMDRLTAKATPEGTLNYTYDAAGHIASIASSNTNGASMSYTYDSLNRLSTVVDNRLSGSNTTTYSYDDASNVATVTYPNGVQSTFTYDTLNRVSGLSSQTSGYTYQRGPAGNLTGATESNGRTESWSYDGIYRLTNEIISLAPSGKNGSVGYALDPVGNRTSDTSSLSGISSGSFSFNADDELTNESYDQNGNVLATGGKTFSYDSQNELISMGSTATLLYNADGNRVSKSVSGVVTKYLVDDLNPTGYPQVFDELTNGSVTRTYAYGLQRIDENQLISNVWTPSFYGYDGGGNVRNLTNSAGAVTDSYEYDAFGNKFTVTGTTPNNYLYRGEQFDPDLGLYYLRARYYNPTTGRFMSRDPLSGLDWDPKTLHKYLYVGSNPVNNVDPSGRDLFEYAIESNAAIPEAKLIDIYGCVADASLAAIDLILSPTPTTSSELGGASAVIGCVALTPGLSELAEAGNRIVKSAQFFGEASGWGSCALDAEDFINALNSVVLGNPDQEEIGKSIQALGGCVQDALGYLLKNPGKSLQGLGLE